MKLWPMRTAEPTTKPGLFCGWRLDAGRRYRDILQVLDYEAVRTRAPSLVYQWKKVHENGDPLCPRLSILSSLLGMSLWSFTELPNSFNTLKRVRCYSPGDSHCRDLFIPHLEEKLGLWKGHWIIPKGSPADLPGPVIFSSTVVSKSGGIFRWNVFRIRIGLHSSVVDQESGHEARLFGLVGTLGHHLSRKHKVSSCNSSDF